MTTRNDSPPKANASLNVRKYALRVAVALSIIGVLGFLVLPPLVKSTLVEKLSAALHRPVSVGNISINPYTLSVQVAGLAIQEKGGGETVAGFESLYFNVEAVSLFRGGPVISELTLLGPTVKVIRLADGRLNFSDLIDEFMAKPDSDDPAPLFSFNNIQLNGGKIEPSTHRSHRTTFEPG